MPDFLCEPWLALVIDGASKIHLYIFPLERALAQLGSNKTFSWSMTTKSIESYRADHALFWAEMSYDQEHSWGALELSGQPFNTMAER